MQATESNQNHFEQFQEEKRKEMQENVEVAIFHLRELGISVTKRSIAQEVGCHENSLRKPYMKAFLSTFKEFQPKKKKIIDQSMTLEEAMKRIAFLEDALEHTRHNNRTLKEDSTQLRKERDDYEEKYRKLLGQYQIDVGKKIQHL